MKPRSSRLAYRRLTTFKKADALRVVAEQALLIKGKRAGKGQKAVRGQPPNPVTTFGRHEYLFRFLEARVLPRLNRSKPLVYEVGVGRAKEGFVSKGVLRSRNSSFEPYELASLLEKHGLSPHIVAFDLMQKNLKAARSTKDLRGRDFIRRYYKVVVKGEPDDVAISKGSKAHAEYLGMKEREGRLYFPKRAVKSVSFVQADAALLPVRKKSDVSLSLNVLENLEPKARDLVFRQLIQNTRKGGFVVVNTSARMTYPLKTIGLEAVVPEEGGVPLPFPYRVFRKVREVQLVE